MALDFNEVQTLASEFFASKESEDNIFEANPVLKMIQANGNNGMRNASRMRTPDGGEYIKVALEYGTHSMTSHDGEFQVVTPTPTNIMTSARFDWKFYRAHMLVTLKEQVQTSGSANQVGSMVAMKSRNLLKSCRDQLGNILYNAETESTSQEFIGLRTAIAASNTYGGIDRSTYTWWAGNVNASAVAMSENLIGDAISDCTHNNEVPDLIVVNRTLYKNLVNQLRSSRTYPGNGLPEPLNRGFRGINIDGVNIVLDTHVPSTDSAYWTAAGITTHYMFVLNTKYIYFPLHPEGAMKLGAFDSSVDQSYKAAPFDIIGSLYLSNSRMHKVFSNVTVS